MQAENKADIFTEDDDTQYATVPTPEWKCGSVRVRSLTASERSAYEGAMWRLGKDGRPSRDMDQVRLGRGRLVALGVVNSQGKRIFSDDDAESLSKKNAAVIDRIASKITELSGMGDSAPEEAKGNS